MYTLDTNAVIYYLKNDAIAVPILKEVFAKPAPIYLSTISEIELLGFSRLGENEEFLIENILQTLAILPVDSRIARIAGNLRRNFGLQLADSAIAATALFTGSALLTRNVKDFQKVTQLSIKEI
ncbi:MAG: hypothetical protein A3C04_00015 [Candidatus Wildermuthbacteria bacterium RIFCSPHIGHO2_02_FULL_45_25]|uniref:PIN domain-containing protein n=1 Tax=Candidatus Wildermuthbacteria bacterium RIFCSPHIGHO2_02_FULL_45_25 TaxID=1802450 RepID=A0A1G2R1K7_9BACT|nr:MAG: hypothetical protein A3C04_00015 [Candidatus Wildermuthbacteria bacterium RIFCSPHIGHO2_02_FULL_45_25]